MRSLRIALLAVLGLAFASPQGKDDYDFGFDAGSHFRREKKGSDGKTRGEYGFRTPDGCMHVVSFEADQIDGYRVLGSSKRDCIFEVPRRPKFSTTSTTRQPATTTRRPATTTKRPTTTTWRPSTLSIIADTTHRPSDTLVLPEVPVVVDNAIVGRQLRRPNLTTKRPVAQPPLTTTTTTRRPGPLPPFAFSTPSSTSEKKPEPLYSFGFMTATHGHTETGLPDGSKKGEYYWDSPEGWRIIVTYEANERGFYPKVRRVRINPTTTTPAPNVPRDNPGNPDETDRIAKNFNGGLPNPSSGCPYFFYYNTRINYHWEHCHLNNTKVGEFGSLGSDGYSHKNAYYADATGFHPTLSRTPLTPRQLEVMAEYSEGVFIVPKPDEERRETEKRIFAWLAENRDQLQNPLR
nr:uncharacterized protein LOC123773742 [Procambarus clarkii]